MGKGVIGVRSDPAFDQTRFFQPGADGRVKGSLQRIRAGPGRKAVRSEATYTVEKNFLYTVPVNEPVRFKQPSSQVKFTR